MYGVHHQFDDLEAGDALRWNGHEYAIYHLGADYVDVSNRRLGRNTVNRMFKSEDIPFEIVRPFRPGA